MKLFSISTIAAALALTSLSSCYKRDNYYVDPNTPVYQYSFSDDFNYDNHNWSFIDPAHNSQVYVSNGQLSYEYHPAANLIGTVAINTGWYSTLNRWDIQSRISSDNAMGLVWGVSNSDNGYSFFIDNRGYFAVYDEGTAGGPSTTLIDWTQNTAIRNGWNNIEVEQVNNTWVGYINNTQVFSIAAHSLYGDQIGFEVLSNTNGSADYLDVKW